MTDGGAVSCVLCSSVTVQNNSQIIGNSADNGGGLYINGLSSHTEISDSLIQANQVAVSDPDDGLGGGLYQVEGSLVIMNTVFDQNTARRSGGGLYTRMLSAGSVGSLLIENSEFTANQATHAQSIEGGGALYIEVKTVEFAETLVQANESSSRGGGVLLIRTGDMNMTNSIFDQNFAHNAGGGLYAVFTELSISGQSVFSANTTVNSGGGVYAQSGSLSIRDAIIDGNTARYGGGINVAQSDLRIINSRISNNQATEHGGGLNSSNSDVTLNGVTGAPYQISVIHFPCRPTPIVLKSAATLRWIWAGAFIWQILVAIPSRVCWTVWHYSTTSLALGDLPCM